MRSFSKIAAAAALSLSALAFAGSASAAAYIAPWTGSVTTSVSLNFGDNRVGDASGAAIYVDGATAADGTGTHQWNGATGAFTDTFSFTLPDGVVGFSDLTIYFDAATAITFSSVDFNGTALTLIALPNMSGFFSTIPHSIVTGGPQTLTVSGTAGANAVWNGSGTFTPAPIPEPGTWALMIMGFGGAGALLRSRRRAGLAIA